MPCTVGPLVAAVPAGHGCVVPSKNNTTVPQCRTLLSNKACWEVLAAFKYDFLEQSFPSTFRSSQEVAQWNDSSMVIPAGHLLPLVQLPQLQVMGHLVAWLFTLACFCFLCK